MKIHAKASNGFCVSITVGRDHGTRVPPLAANMLHEVLQRTGVEQGKWAYQVTGTCPHLTSHSRYVMSVAPAKDRALRVHMKCAKSRESTVTGLLRIPTTFPFQDFFLKFKVAAEQLNNEHWASLWQRATDEEMDESVGVAASLASSQIPVDAESPRLVLVSNNEPAAMSPILESRVELGASDQQQPQVPTLHSGGATLEPLTRRQAKLRRLLEERQHLNEQILALIGSRTREEIIALLLE